MKYAQAAILAAALWLSFPAPSPACSLAAGYLPPSNFELVRDTEGIVLAKCTKSIPNEREASQMVFDVVKVLKGDPDVKTLTLMGWDAWRGSASPEDFSGPRPGAYSGACNAYDYKVDLHFLLFLQGSGRNRWVSGPPFTRINEDVSGPDAPWVKAVTHYVRIAALGTVDLQKAALRELASRTENPVPGLAADIRHHFATPHDSKSYEDLKKIYDETQNAGVRANVLWAFAKGKHTAAVDVVCGLVDSGDWLRFSGPISRYTRELKSASVSEALLKQLGEKQVQLNAYTRREILEAVAEGADAASTPALIGLLKPESPEDLLALKSYFVRHPDPKATALYAQYAGKEFEQAQPDLTLAIAAMGDRGVLDWALAPDKIGADYRWLSPAVIAVSPLPEAEKAVQEILKTADPKIVLDLIRGYGRSRSPQRIPRILECYSLQAKDPAMARGTRDLLQKLAREGDDAAAEAYKKLFPGNPESDDR
jgi:hypothetical protein